MSHLFLTLSLGSGRVLTCSQFDLALFLLRCLLFALLQAASMRTSDLTQLLCGLLGRSQRAGPVAKEPPKHTNEKQSLDRLLFICIQPHNSSDAEEEQTLTPNQLIWEVSPDKGKHK